MVVPLIRRVASATKPMLKIIPSRKKLLVDSGIPSYGPFSYGWERFQNLEKKRRKRKRKRERKRR